MINILLGRNGTDEEHPNNTMGGLRSPNEVHRAVSRLLVDVPTPLPAVPRSVDVVNDHIGKHVIRQGVSD